MKFDVKIPEVGESISEVVLAKWLKKDGEFVEADDLLCEIESDKASFELPAEQSGALKHMAEEGDTIEVGGVIAQIDGDAASENSKAEKREAGSEDPETSKAEKKEADSEAPETAEAGEKKADSTARAKEEKETPKASEKSKAPEASGEVFQIKVPEVGESITEVTIARWLKKDGESVEADDLIVEIESDKASFEIPAEQSGVISLKVSEGDTVPVGSLIAEIKPDGQTSAEAETKSAAPVKEVKPSLAESTDGEKDKKIKISPVAANILVEAGLKAESVSGSGPGGRITKEDAVKAVENLKTREKEAPSPKKEDKSVPAVSESPDRQVRRERLSTLRKTLSKRLVAAKNETAMLTTFNEVDMSGIMALRAKYKEIFKEKYEVGLGFMSFFTKAACIALKEWPAVNAKIDGDHVVYHDYCDISIAVSSPRGLVVPVIRNANRLSMAEIEKEVLNLATKARENKLTIEEMTGGTFTISNGGVFGSLMSTPILNAPQSAILGMHKIEERPVVTNGEVVIRPMMYLAVSYDHRIIDGRESVSFLVRVKELLEDPARMLLEI